MGLDIYLESKQEQEASEARDRAWNEFYASKPTPDQMREWHENNGPRQFETVKSAQWPEHFFNRRYLRSSYNGSGFDRKVPDLIEEELGFDPTFYGIFEPITAESQTLDENDIPLIQQCAERALRVAAALRRSDSLSVLSVAHNQFLPLATTTDDAALTWYREQIKKKQITLEGWWSSKDGHVFGTEGMTVLAAVPGDQFGSPCVHLIYRMPEIDFYAQGADITAEFCDEAVKLIETDGSARLIWSG